MEAGEVARSVIVYDNDGASTVNEAPRSRQP
jgi:hypothetical protein